MKWRMRLAVLGLGLVFATSNARAQTHHLHLGASALYNFDAETFGLGGQLSLPIASHLEFYPSVAVYFPDAGSLMTLNADLKYRVPGQVGTWLYLGTGVGFTRASLGDFSDTHAKWNLIAGAESLKGKIHPFVEGRILVGTNTSAQISVGLNLTLNEKN